MDNNINKHCAVFSGQEIQFDAKEFSGAKLTAVFGGIDLDLTKAQINQDVNIKVCAIFGGIDIKVPKDIAVKVKSCSIFGGVSNKNKEIDPKAHTIYVKSFCLFGGCDIKE